MLTFLQYIKVKCLDPKTYAGRERKTLSFSINKVAEFLQAFLFATALFKGPTAQTFKGIHCKFIQIQFTQIERKVFTFDLVTRSDHSKRGFDKTGKNWF